MQFLLEDVFFVLLPKFSLVLVDPSAATVQRSSILEP
jgi:hypothetical protein